MAQNDEERKGAAKPPDYRRGATVVHYGGDPLTQPARSGTSAPGDLVAGDAGTPQGGLIHDDVPRPATRHPSRALSPGEE